MKSLLLLILSTLVLAACAATPQGPSAVVRAELSPLPPAVDLARFDRFVGPFSMDKWEFPR